MDDAHLQGGQRVYVAIARDRDAAEDARYLDHYGISPRGLHEGDRLLTPTYWNMTPAQRAGITGGMLVNDANAAHDADQDSTHSPQEGSMEPQYLGPDGNFPATYANFPGFRRGALLTYPGVYGPPKDDPQATSDGGGLREPRRFQDADKAERIRVAMLHNRIKGVLAGWGAGPDIGKEPKATVAELTRLQEWTSAQLAHLTMYPPEPELGSTPCVIRFTRTFTGHELHYAAIRVPNGRHGGMWTVTGSTASKYFSWEDLMAWIAEGTPSDRPVTIEVIDTWTHSS